MITSDALRQALQTTRFQTTAELAADAEFFAQSADAQDTPWGRGCAAVLRQCAAALAAPPDVPVAPLGYNPEREWERLFQGSLKDDPMPGDPVDKAMAFLRIWANSFLANGLTWDVPATMSAALNQVILILEDRLVAPLGIGQETK